MSYRVNHPCGVHNEAHFHAVEFISAKRKSGKHTKGKKNISVAS